MSRAHIHIRLTRKQREELKSFMQELGMKKPPDRHRMRLRAQVIWFSSPDYPDPSVSGPYGLTVREICQRLGVSERSVRRWFAMWEAHGIEGVRTRRMKDQRSYRTRPRKKVN